MLAILVEEGLLELYDAKDRSVLARYWWKYFLMKI